MIILILWIALFFAAISTPLIREIALRLNFVDRPNADRAHQAVTPLMGGVAIYLGLTIPMALLEIFIISPFLKNLTDYTLPASELGMIIFCGTVMMLIGLWDDRKVMRPYMKFPLQALTVGLLVATTDIVISLPVPYIVNLFLTLCWFLYVINAFNFMDNMDGVSSITSAVAATSFLLIAIINGQWIVASLAAAVAGTSFGFLRFNLFSEDQKIFMGDAGALFLGFLLAILGIKLRFAAKSPWITWPVPVLVLGVPLFDTALVFISRFRRKRGFLRGGIDHTSHRLARIGLGRYGVPFAIGLVSAVLGSTAIMVMYSDLLGSIAIQVTTGVVALYALYKLEFTVSPDIRTGNNTGR